MSKMEIADKVLQRQDKDGMLRRALERIIQLYTDKSHFVYELLQNAEDAGASRIEFQQYPDKLVVLHDGHPFTLENLQGLCDIGKSDKVDDLNQIGEFGVGFKSVFGICERVQLYSHPSEKDIKEGYNQFAIEILNFTQPIDIEDQNMEPGYTTKFIFPFSVGFPFSGFETVEELNRVLSKRLQNLGITTLLFMKNLQDIKYTIKLPELNTTGSYSLNKKVINDHCVLITAIDNENESEKDKVISYLVFSRPVKGIQVGRTIDIAFALSIDKNGKYDFKSSQYPYISVYFPTETESKLKFIVQGPYRTTPNRSSVPCEDKDNIELAKQTAQLLRDSIIELRDAGRLDYSLLNILPIDDEVFYSAPLFEGMFKETLDMFTKEKLLLCKNGTYADSCSVKIARGAEFAELFTDKLLTELLDDGKEYHWLPTFLTETNKKNKNVYNFLTNKLTIDVIRPENLKNVFNKNKQFLKNRDDEWIVRLYKLYSSIGAAFSKERGSSNMLTAEFIKTSKGDFIAPYRRSDGKDLNYSFYSWEYENASYLPNIFLPSENESNIGNIIFVDKKIYEQCKFFFKEILGLQKPNKYAFFIDDFKKRNESCTCFTDDQHIIDVKYLLSYRSEPDYRDEVDKIIKKYLRLKCMKDGKTLFINPNKEKVFFSVTADGMSIEQYYKNIAVYAYVDVDFYANNDITMDDLRKLGIKEDIAVGDDDIAGRVDLGNPGRKPEWNTSGTFRWQLSLDKLEAVAEYISLHPNRPDSLAKSSFIFRFLMKNEDKLQGYLYIGANRNQKEYRCAKIITFLRSDESKYINYGNKWNGKWLYTESLELVSPTNISKHDLNTQLYGEINKESRLYEILGLKRSEADILEDVAKDYDRLSEEKKDLYFKLEFERRYHISIDELKGYLRDKQGYDNGGNSLNIEDTYEFPSLAVKNWDSLRKHVAEMLCFANPVKYEYRVRKLRVSKPESEIRAYIMNMYKVDRTYKYACQMCRDPFSDVVMCQIEKNPEVELDPMNLCMCPNCASKYRKMRAEKDKLKSFLEDIKNLNEIEIEKMNPVGVRFGEDKIWFTQTHIAEIKELILLQDEVHNHKDDRCGELANESSEKVIAGIDVYKEYVGKRVRHKNTGIGIVRKVEGDVISIEYEDGPKAGRLIKYSLEICINNGFLEII